MSGGKQAYEQPVDELFDKLRSSRTGLTSAEVKDRRKYVGSNNLGFGNIQVVRDGKVKSIDSAKLVPGDIIQLEPGDTVPADVITLEENVALLAGAISKSKTQALVIATGDQTELGRLDNFAAERSSIDPPLRQIMTRLFMRTGLIVLVLWASLFFVSIYTHLSSSDWIIFADGILLAVVPFGLVPAVAIMLAKTASHLFGQKLLVKDLLEVDTVGRTNVVVADLTSLRSNSPDATSAIVGRTHYDLSSAAAAEKFTDILNTQAYTQDDPTSVIAKATKLWDHGHVRNFTDSDKKFFTEYLNKRLASAEQTSAAYYADGNDTVFLCLISSAMQFSDDTIAAAAWTQKVGLEIKILSDESPESNAAIVGKLGLTDSAILTYTDAIDFFKTASKTSRIVVAATSYGRITKLAAINTDVSFASLILSIKQSRRLTKIIQKAIVASIADSSSLLSLVVVSLVADITWNIPLAATLMQIVAILFVTQMPLVAMLAWDKTIRKTSAVGVLFGPLAAALAYANFLFYFYRHNISPSHISTVVGPYLQASTIAFMTIAICQYINFLLLRGDLKSIKDHRHLLWTAGLSAFFVLNIIYNPLLQPLFGTGALSYLDWAAVFLAALLYTAARQFHIHTSKHSGKNLIRKHGAEKVLKHIQKRLA